MNDHYRLTRHDSVEGLLEEYSIQKGSKRGVCIDLGCGYYKPKGFIGIDNMSGTTAQITIKDNYPDVIMDLNSQQIPFPDECALEIRASHFLEHSNLPHIFDEVFRLLQPGGIFLFTVPYANSAEGMFPGHTIFLTEKFFYENLHFQRCFKILEESYKPSEIYDQLSQDIKKLFPFEVARKVLFNACKEMTIKSVVRK